MKVALIQTKQNKLYNFIDPQTRFTREEALSLQQEMLEQLFAFASRLEQDCDLLITTEAVNFCGFLRDWETLHEMPARGWWRESITAGQSRMEWRDVITLHLFITDRENWQLSMTKST